MIVRKQKIDKAKGILTYAVGDIEVCGLSPCVSLFLRWTFLSQRSTSVTVIELLIVYADPHTFFHS